MSSPTPAPPAPALDGRRCDEASVRPSAGTTPDGTVAVTAMWSAGCATVSLSVGGGSRYVGQSHLLRSQSQYLGQPTAYLLCPWCFRNTAPISLQCSSEADCGW